VVNDVSKKEVLQKEKETEIIEFELKDEEYKSTKEHE